MSNDVKKYLKDCKHIFPFFGKNEKQFFIRLKEGIDTYYDTHNHIYYEDIVKEFGTPKVILESYINSCDNEYILKKMKILSLLKKITIIVLSFLIAITFLEFYTINQMKTEKILIEEEVIEYYE